MLLTLNPTEGNLKGLETMKYQYLIVTIDNASDSFLTSVLDGYGRDGWELVSVTWTLHGEKLKYTFKMVIQ